MKWNKVPALAGCLALALAGPAVLAQAGTTAGSPQTNPTAGSAQPPAAGPGQTTAMPGMAQTNESSNAAGSGKSSDKKFVKKAMAGGEAEVTLGKMAAEKASSPDVKEFGQKMVDDHGKLNDQMKPIASQMGISEPTSLPHKDQALQKKLEGLSGADFDKAYMSAMVKDHRKDLSEFQQEASSGKDPQVKDAAQQGAQVIQQHLELAEQVAQKVGAKSGKMGRNAKGSNGTMNPTSESPSTTPSNTPSTPSTTTSPQ
jgi:putative membrane protein